MIKRILVVATGGTIGSSFQDGCRRLDIDVAEGTLLKDFAESSSEFAALGKELFVDSHLETRTLSENMTTKKLFAIAKHIREQNTEELRGIIVLHGTDTLAYTSSMLSLYLCDISVPLVLVSGNRPPEDEKSNARANFRAAVELICRGLAPNVYAVYRNSDGRIYLHLGSTLMQCGECSEDFLNASREKMFLLDENNELSVNDAEKCRELSMRRRTEMGNFMQSLKTLDGHVLLISPYVGLDYRTLSLDGVLGVVHGAYHSGTVCVDGEEAGYSALCLAVRCREKGIPLFVSPCVLSEEQYESAFVAVRGGLVPLNYTIELAYCKLLLGASAGLRADELVEFMKIEINGELLC